MGLTSRRVLRIFVFQGLVIGLVGSLRAAWGAAAELPIDRFHLIRIPGDIYFVSYLPVRSDPMGRGRHPRRRSVLISLMAAIYPRCQAARLTPVEAIRHE